MSLRERIAGPGRARGPAPQPDDLRRLSERLGHLEALVEGLQDAIHRDSVRHEERVAEFERTMQPEALAKALSGEARRRGL
jgi:hypothetical protein